MPIQSVAVMACVRAETVTVRKPSEKTTVMTMVVTADSLRFLAEAEAEAREAEATAAEATAAEATAGDKLASLACDHHAADRA